MNKIIFGFIILFPGLAWANSFKAQLSYKTNIGYSRSHVLESNGKQLSLNGIELSSQRIILGRPKIQYLLNERNKEGPEARCPAGVYEYQVDFNQRYEENGCIGSARFNQLLKLMEAL